MVANPFLRLKIAHLKATVRTSINVKTGSPDPADFAITRLIIHWRVLAIRAMVGATVGISRQSQIDIPMN
jgi:hypothetical protein